MPIAVNCSCGQVYSVRDEFAGRSVECASCHAAVVVPASPQHTPGPRLRPSGSPSQPASGSSVVAVIFTALLLIIVGGSGLVAALNWDQISRLLGISQQAGREPIEEEEKVLEPPLEVKPPDPPLKDPPPKPDPKPDDPPPPPPMRHPPFQGHAGTVFRAAYSPDGLLALSASGGVDGEGDALGPAADTSLRLWDVRSGQQMKRWQSFPNGIAAAAFSPGGRFALLAAAGMKKNDAWTAGADLDLHLWDLKEGKELRRLNGHIGEVFCIAFSPDGKHALSGGKDSVIRVWEIDTGKEINRLVGHTNTVNSLAFTPDGKHVLSGGSDMTVRYWELKDGKELKQLPGHQDIVWSVAVSSDGRQALSAGGYQPGPGNKGLVTGSKDFAIRLWDLTAFKEVRRLEGHTGAVSAAAFTPDGRRIVSASADRSVRLWLASTGRQLHTFTGHARLIHTLALSSDGRRALTGGDGGELKAWTLPAEIGDLLRALREATASADRVRAAAELGLYGAEACDAIPDLLRAALSEDLPLRRAALASLVQIGRPKPDHLAILEPMLLPAVPAEVRAQALDSLAALGPDAKPALNSAAALLKDSDAGLRSRAARMLGALGPTNRTQVAPLLVQTLRDSNAEVGTAARQALDALGPVPVGEIKLVGELLADSSEPVRRYALETLAAMKEKARPALPELSRAATQYSSAELRRQALQALSAIAPADKAVLAVLMQALKDREAAVARQAVQALVQAGPAAALPGLLTALEHKDAEVVKTADEALENAKWDKDDAKALGEALLSTGAGPRPKLLKFLTALEADAADAVPAVREMLKKSEPKEVLPLLALLAKIGSPAKAAGPDLVPFLKRDPKMPLTPLMLETAHLLADIEAMEAADAVPILISAIRIEDEEEASIERRGRAMKALVKVGKPAVSKLARALDGEFYIGTTRTPGMPARALARYRVMEILVTIGSKDAATAEVFKALAYLERNDPFPDVRLGARQARLKLLQKEEPPMKDEKNDPKKDG